MTQYDGAEIFKLMDTYGLPLDIINMMLRERGAFFSAPEFIQAAKIGRWKEERIYQTLLSASPLQGNERSKLSDKLKQIILC